MSIHIIFAPGGGGKSFYQMLIIENQLLNTARNIVTNLAVDVPALAEYMARVYPHRETNVGARIRLLTEEETPFFWKYRGPLRWDARADYELIEDKGEKGVCYVIDEAGAAGFSAQAWAESVGRSTRGVLCTAYLDQQRKHGDDVFASTNGRTPNQIAKAFRDKAHYFIKCRNGYLAQWGIFRGKGEFSARWFLEEPGPKSEHMRKEVWKLDTKGLANCYRTEQGVGVLGTNADKGQRAKGITITWLIPAFMAVALMIVGGPWLMGKFFQKAITPKAARSAPPAKPSHVDAKASPPPSAPIPGQISVAVAPQPAPRKVRGVVVGNGRVTVTLSDGTVWSESDLNGAVIERHRIVKDGETIYFAQPQADVVTRSAVSPVSDKPVKQEVQKPAPIPQQSAGSWVTGADGVQRLREAVTFAAPGPR